MTATTQEPKAKKKAIKAEKPAPAPAPAPAVETTKTDEFGAREGTSRFALDAALTTTPQTMKELLTAAGLTETMYNWLNKLAKEKLILKTKDGKYARKPKMKKDDVTA